MTVTVTVTLALLSAATPTASAFPSVANFQCRTPYAVHEATVREISSAYGGQSVAIVQAALGRRIAFLSQTIAPEATFMVIRGDVGIGPRSKGPQAAIELARIIAPRNYRFVLTAGPISMDPCGKQTAEVMFQGSQPNEMTVAKFYYQDGFLIEVAGSKVGLVSGAFSKPTR